MGLARVGIYQAQVVRAGNPKAAIGTFNAQLLKKAKPTATANIGILAMQVARARAALYLTPGIDTLAYTGREPILANFIDPFNGDGNLPVQDLNWDLVTPATSPHTFYRNNNRLEIKCIDGGPVITPKIRSRFKVTGNFDASICTTTTAPAQSGSFQIVLRFQGLNSGSVNWRDSRWFNVHRWHIDENDVQVTWGNITFANVSDIRLIREGNLFRYLYRLNNDAWVQATSRTYVMDTVGYFDIWYYYDTVNYIAETATIDNFTVRGALSEFGTFRPAAKAMTFTGYAPTLSTLRENQVNVPVGNMTLALTTISITKDINPIGIDELVFTTYEPNPGVGPITQVPTGSATFTTYAPTVSSASLDYSEILGLLALNIEN